MGEFPLFRSSAEHNVKITTKHKLFNNSTHLYIKYTKYFVVITTSLVYLVSAFQILNYYTFFFFFNFNFNFCIIIIQIETRLCAAVLDRRGSLKTVRKICIFTINRKSRFKSNLHKCFFVD